MACSVSRLEIKRKEKHALRFVWQEMYSDHVTNELQNKLGRVARVTDTG